MRAPVLIALALLVALPAQASAQRSPAVAESPDLWATVNVCDTATQPDAIGIRASMPGTGRRERAFMRFRAQYLSRADGRWHNVGRGADSGWVRLGTTTRAVLESGWTFTFRAPAGGGVHTMRGAVTFLWKRGSRNVRRLREFTEAGHRSTRGADPPGYTAATCEIA